MPETKFVTLKVTENQLRYIMHSLECHFRLTMGQAWDLADELCEQNTDWRQSDKYCERRDTVRNTIERVIRDVAFEGDTTRGYKTPRTQAEIDLWSAIRHWFWSQLPPDQRGDGVDSYPPMQLGEEPLPCIAASAEDSKEK